MYIFYAHFMIDLQCFLNLLCDFSELDFRYQQSFHGIDLASLRSAAVKEYFTQPIVVSNVHTCMG